MARDWVPVKKLLIALIGASILPPRQCTPSSPGKWKTGHSPGLFQTHAGPRFFPGRYQRKKGEHPGLCGKSHPSQFLGHLVTKLHEGGSFFRKIV